MRTGSLRISILAGVAALGISCAGPTQASVCEALNRVVNTGIDASKILSDCLKSLQPSQQLALLPGSYTLSQPMDVAESVTITTLGLFQKGQGCAQLPNRCAVLRLAPSPSVTSANTMPLLISGNDVTLDHLVVRGVGMSGEQRARCRSHALRPLGGGLRVSGSRFTIRNSVLRDFACYSSLEIVKSATQPRVEHNVIGPNGDHDPGDVWSDGVTIQDTSNAIIEHNLFLDNTDVQLIFGGCRNCRVEYNTFRHTGSFASASFAELMLQSWPATSGQYAGTVVQANGIDCGPRHRCGYGIMIGSAPWYEGKMAGGEITQNRIANAMIGINVDKLTGPVQIQGNVVINSGGQFRSDCGERAWPAVNVSPESLPFLRGEPANVRKETIETSRCLVNREEHQ